MKSEQRLPRFLQTAWEIAAERRYKLYLRRRRGLGRPGRLKRREINTA
jgi:hypothetical protein